MDFSYSFRKKGQASPTGGGEGALNCDFTLSRRAWTAEFITFPSRKSRERELGGQIN